MSYSKNYRLIEGDANEEITVFEEEFSQYTENQFEKYKDMRKIENIHVGQRAKLPACINIKRSIEGSGSMDKYLEAAKQSKKQQIAVFAVVNDNVYPLHYDDSGEELVKFYEVEIGRTFMITPEVKFDKGGEYDLSLVIVSYPYAYPEKLAGTFMTSNWTSPIISIPVTVHVVD